MVNSEELKSPPASPTTCFTPQTATVPMSSAEAAGTESGRVTGCPMGLRGRGQGQTLGTRGSRGKPECGGQTIRCHEEESQMLLPTASQGQQDGALPSRTSLGTRR